MNLWTIAAVTLLCTTVAAQTNTAEFTELAQRASSAQLRGDYKKAAELYDQLAAERPQIPEIRANVGLMLYLSGDYKSAEKQFRRALSQERNLSVANLFLGLSLVKLQQYSSALPYLTYASKEKPFDPTIHIQLAKAYTALAEYRKANDEYWTAIELNPTVDDGWYGLGITYLSIQRNAIQDLSSLKDSSQYLKQLSAVNPSLAERTTRADFVNAYAAALQAPRDPVAVSNLASVSGMLALEAVAKARELNPREPYLFVLLGNVYSERHAVAEAEAQFNKALELRPDDIGAHLGLATMYVREGWPDRAAPHLAAVFALNPKDPEASYLQAKVLIEEQRFSEAIPVLEQALKGESANAPHVHAMLGKAYAKTGQPQKGIEELKQALVADRVGDYHYQLARLYLAVGDKKDAAATLAATKSLIQRANQPAQTQQ